MGYPVELTAQGAIQDIMDCVGDAQWLGSGEPFHIHRARDVHLNTT